MLQDFLNHHKQYGLWWYAECINQQLNIYGTQQAIRVVEDWREKFATDSTIRKFCTQLLDLMY